MPGRIIRVKWRILLVCLAVAGLLVPLRPSFIERRYSSELFPSIQASVTAASNRTAVPWLDVLLIVVAAWLVAACLRDVATRRPFRALVRVLWRFATVAAIGYLAFLMMWGLNYRRVPLIQKLPFDRGRVTPGAAAELARDTVARVNALYGVAHREGWAGPLEIDPTLARTFQETTRSLAWHRAVVPGRPKQSILDLYFRRAGVAGMTDPVFLETLVASDTLPFERPHVVAHEWAHLAGIPDEGEANFLGWLVCVRGSAGHRYSGWLFLYGEMIGALPGHVAREVSASLEGGPRADLQAARQRAAREVSPRLSSAGWQVYDRYLKANRVGAGTASYAEVVQLVLGTNLR